MPKTFAVNEKNDLYIGRDGNLAIAEGLEAVKQLCEQVSNTRLGEMVLHTNQGIPFFQSLWGGTRNLAQFEAALRVALSNVPEVTRILEISIEVQDDTLNYTAVILTTYGQGVISNFINI